MSTFDEGDQVPVECLPDDTLVYLLPSRFCESDELLDVSWKLFPAREAGVWSRPERSVILFRTGSASTT